VKETGHKEVKKTADLAGMCIFRHSAAVDSKHWRINCGLERLVDAGDNEFCRQAIARSDQVRGSIVGMQRLYLEQQQ